MICVDVRGSEDKSGPPRLRVSSDVRGGKHEHKGVFGVYDCIEVACAGTQLQCLFSCACMIVCVHVCGLLRGGGSRHRECDSVSGTQSSDTAPPPPPISASFLSSLQLPPPPLPSPLSPLPANPASLSRSLHLRRPTQTSINNSDRVALQVSPPLQPRRILPSSAHFSAKRMYPPPKKKIQPLLFLFLYEMLLNIMGWYQQDTCRVTVFILPVLLVEVSPSLALLC